MAKRSAARRGGSNFFFRSLPSPIFGTRGHFLPSCRGQTSRRVASRRLRAALSRHERRRGRSRPACRFAWLPYTFLKMTPFFVSVPSFCNLDLYRYHTYRLVCPYMYRTYACILIGYLLIQLHSARLSFTEPLFFAFFLRTSKFSVNAPFSSFR